MAHVSQEKKDVVKKILELSSNYPILGIVNMANLPAKQLQNMREQLRGKVLIFMTKRRLMKVAFNALEGKVKNIVGLIEHLGGQPALIFTKDNPFSLFRILKKNKSSAPAKAGQIAPNNIVIPAGLTPFAPGPVIGELGALGVKSQVENGKIAVTSDTVVCEEGKEISPKLAEMLGRMDINPMEVGLDLNGILEEGVVYTKAVLDIDEDSFKRDLARAASWAYNLAVECAYPSPETVNVLVGKAYRDSKCLGIEAGILSSGTTDDILGKAERQMLSVKMAGNIDVPEKASVQKKSLDVEKKPIEDKTAEKKTPEKKAEKEVAEEISAVKEESEEKTVENVPADDTEKNGSKTQVEDVETPKQDEKQLGKDAEQSSGPATSLDNSQKKVEKEPVPGLPDSAEKHPEEEVAVKETATDEKIAKMVEETRKFAKGEVPSAEKIVEELDKDSVPKKMPEKVPTAHELAKKKKQD